MPGVSQQHIDYGLREQGGRSANTVRVAVSEHEPIRRAKATVRDIDSKPSRNPFEKCLSNDTDPLPATFSLL